MNKKLIAIAIAAGLAAPMAANAAPTVWGKAHVSLDMYDSGNGGVGSDSNYISSNSSRLGIKGEEDLGGGLSALYAYEFAVNPADSGTVGDSRNAYVGLKGGFGTVLMGRHDTPFKTVGRKTDLFGDMVGDLRNLTRPGGFRWDERANNVIVYKNKFGAAKFAAAYVLEDGVDDATALSASVGFKAGPVDVKVAYESHEEGLVAGTTGEDGLRVALAAKAGPADVRFMYSTMSDINGTSGADADVMSIGAAFPMGKNKFKVQYNMRDNEGNDNDAATLAVGIDHKFSKNTTGYIAYATTDNDANVNYRVDAAGHGQEGQAPTNGNDPDVISIGLIVKF